LEGFEFELDFEFEFDFDDPVDVFDCQRITIGILEFILFCFFSRSS